MLITELKSRETIESLADGQKVFIINCLGCKEVHFPEKEAVSLQKELAADGAPPRGLYPVRGVGKAHADLSFCSQFLLQAYCFFFRDSHHRLHM